MDAVSYIFFCGGGGEGLRECETTENSPISSTKVKNSWSYTSSPSYDFMVFTGMTLHTYVTKE